MSMLIVKVSNVGKSFKIVINNNECYIFNFFKKIHILEHKGNFKMVKIISSSKLF